MALPHFEACLNSMSLEILCLILGYLPVRDVLKVESLSRRLQQAVHMHLQLLTELDLCEGQLYGWVPPTLTDPILTRLLSHCTELTVNTRLRASSAFTRSVSGSSEC